MKKIKIMMLSLALFAVVGGALAFKAKFDDQFCVTTIGAASACKDLKCPTTFTSSTFDEDATENLIYCTADAVDCTAQLPCDDILPTSIVDNN